MKNVIEVKNLVKKYAKAKENAVDDISFEVREGEFFAFLGPNGAGKTTTISILTTTLSKTSGEVKIAGYDLDRHATQVRQNIGVIFQKPSLDQNLTAEENVRFHAVLYGIYPFRPTFSAMPESYKKKVQELADLLGITEGLNKPIKTFSGGMKRKLEIIRSLMHNPKVLFLDEPTSGLDPISRKSLWDYLQKVRDEEKTTIFLTTHYLEEAEGSDRVCVINNGKIITLGTPRKIKDDLIEEYLLLDTKKDKRHELKAQLKKLKVKHTEDSPMKVYMNGKSAQEIIQKISVPLTTLETHIPSLEDAYFELITEDEKR